MNAFRNIAAAATLVVLAGCNQGPAAPDKTVQQLMAEDVQPTADIYWKSVQYISDETGEHDIFPRTDEEWARVRDGATQLGKLGVLLQSPAYAEGRGEDWMQFAQSLVDVSKLAEQTTVEKDRDKVLEVGSTIDKVCDACHTVYPAPGTEDETAG